MTSPRLYREPLSVQDALGELESGAGTEFDPDLVIALAELVRSGELEWKGRSREWAGT